MNFDEHSTNNINEQHEREEIEINDESEHDWLSDVLDKPTFKGHRKSMRNKSPDVQIIESDETNSKKTKSMNFYVNRIT